MRSRYANKAITDAVKNVATADRIIDYDGMLVQKVFPIYMDDPKPRHPLDISANLYQPAKYFAGRMIDTFVFNTAVIWLMTLILFITLYFDALRKFIQMLEGSRKYRKKDRAV